MFLSLGISGQIRKRVNLKCGKLIKYWEVEDFSVVIIRIKFLWVAVPCSSEILKLWK
jgi:hypothetical protein